MIFPKIPWHRKDLKDAAERAKDRIIIFGETSVTLPM